MRSLLLCRSLSFSSFPLFPKIYEKHFTKQFFISSNKKKCCLFQEFALKLKYFTSELSTIIIKINCQICFSWFFQFWRFVVFFLVPHTAGVYILQNNPFPPGVFILQNKYNFKMFDKWGKKLKIKQINWTLVIIFLSHFSISGLVSPNFFINCWTNFGTNT